MTSSVAWKRHASDITSCRRCPRLVSWRERIAREKVRRFSHEEYWGRPVPGFGDSRARLLVVGLAPAAHGANRTGRMFTGDRSGDWLYEALYKFGFASQAASTDANDGLSLHDCYITAACRCAPPGNKPLPAELAACRPFLKWEVDHLRSLRIILGLGRIGFDTALAVATLAGHELPSPRPRFSHGIVAPISPKLTVMGLYHPSQQNTFTGKLTRGMFHSGFRHIAAILKSP